MLPQLCGHQCCADRQKPACRALLNSFRAHRRWCFVSSSIQHKLALHMTSMSAHRQAWLHGAAVLMIVASSVLVAEATLPQDLTNFQNEYACNPQYTLIVR